jgi:recombinational DNA repair ATPase RecF
MKQPHLFIAMLGLVVAAQAQAQAPAPAAQKPAAQPAAAAPAAKKPATPADSAEPAVKTSTAAQDRLELETTQITGNRELPRVLYVVPWKRPDLGELNGRPARSLLDEVLAPVDRDVFRRQNRYHEALKPDSTAP